VGCDVGAGRILSLNSFGKAWISYIRRTSLAAGRICTALYVHITSKQTHVLQMILWYALCRARPKKYLSCFFIRRYKHNYAISRGTYETRVVANLS